MWKSAPKSSKMRGGRKNSIAPMLWRPQKKPAHTSSAIGWFLSLLKGKDFVRLFRKATNGWFSNSKCTKTAQKCSIFAQIKCRERPLVDSQIVNARKPRKMRKKSTNDRFSNSKWSAMLRLIHYLKNDHFRRFIYSFKIYQNHKKVTLQFVKWTWNALQVTLQALYSL